MQENKSDLKKEKQLDIILSYIKDNVEIADIDGLAKRLNYSKSYTGILVKSVTGLSFSQLLQTARCQEAAGLFKSKELSVSEVINKIGYENESFLEKSLRKYMVRHRRST